MICGIYKLVFKGTDTVYIGQSTDIHGRFIEHKAALRKAASSKKLNAAYAQYGEPTLEILVECSKIELDSTETEAISIYNAVDNGFNTQYAGNTGSRPSLQGELGPMATCTNEEVRRVFHLLVDTPSLRRHEISKIVGISVNIVKDISCGVNHHWLKQEFPDKYTMLLSMIGTRNSGEFNSTSIYKEEELLKVFDMCVDCPEVPLREVANILKVPYDTVKSLANGNNHKWIKLRYPDRYALLLSFKGSRRITCHSAKSQSKSYPAIRSPEGKDFLVENIKAFAREHGLNEGHLGAVLRGRETQHKNWVLAPCSK